MLQFFRSPQPHEPNAALLAALTRDGLVAGGDGARLAVLDQKGSYSGRRVNYFRVFDPRRSAEVSTDIKNFEDLDAHPDLVLGSGHVERDGVVILSKRADLRLINAVRSEADRADHTDDEAFVFPKRAT